MKALVTFALETEFAPWRQARKFSAADWNGSPVFSTEINGLEVGVLLTGAGPKLAETAAARVIKSEIDSLRFCISSGLAGGLRPEYRAGQLVAARTVISEEGRAVDAGSMLDSSEALISFASECGATVVERFLTTLRVVGRADEKKHLGASADAVEMESFGVLSAAREKGIPAVAIRVIGDTVDENLPLDMNEVLTDEGRVSIPRVLGQVARNPSSLPGLMRLGQDSKRSATALCEFLDRYMQRLAEAAQVFDSKRAAGNG
jgi:adenosylhomocysteine nucleosidase